MGLSIHRDQRVKPIIGYRVVCDECWKNERWTLAVVNVDMRKHHFHSRLALNLCGNHAEVAHIPEEGESHV